MRASSRCTGSGDTLFYEIPKAELGKDFLWNTQIKKTTIGAGYGGQNVGSRVVRWVPKGDRVLLVTVDYSVIADPADPVAMAVEDSNYPAIIRTFPVAAYAAGGDPVIDVTDLFTTDIPEFSARGRVGGRGMDDAPLVPRARGLVPGEHQRRGHDDLHRGRGRSAARRRPPVAARAGAAGPA